MAGARIPNEADAKPDFKKFVEETVAQLEKLTIEDKGLTPRRALRRRPSRRRVITGPCS